jgi:hypothetical protein
LRRHIAILRQLRRHFRGHIFIPPFTADTLSLFIFAFQLSIISHY